MIYDNSFLKKELKETYFEQSISSKRRLSYALFLALISLGCYLMLLTLERSILSDVVPRYFDRSYYSVLSVYNDVSYIFYIIYLAANYRFITFDEIRENKWYILIKFGFNPVRMIYTKLYARLLTVLIIYGTGFIAVSFLATYLKYPIVYSYFLPLFILGLVDIIFVLIVTMTTSLYLGKSIWSNYLILLYFILLVFLKYYFDYYSHLNAKNQFQDIFVLTYFARYFLTLFVIMAISILTIFIRAKRNSRYFNFAFYVKDLDFSDNLTIVFGKGDKKKSILKEYALKTRMKISTKITSSLLVGVISIFILFNLFVLLISLSTPGRELSIAKIIPYVFHSETMEPEIMYNDLVFFKKTHINQNFKVGDIVLYKSDNEVSVSRIKVFQGENLVVDIDKYPEGNQNSIFRETIDKSLVYGLFIGKSRWLGVLVLFSNTTLGRLLLLLIPSLLLFYYKSISHFISLINYERMKER